MPKMIFYIEFALITQNHSIKAICTAANPVGFLLKSMAIRRLIKSKP
jgi:hypothetical protein